MDTAPDEQSPGGASDSFPTRPDDDFEHARILAAVQAELFGTPSMQIGHYRIERLLGSGGMGEVFLAYDQTLERPVALKVLRRELAVADLGARLRAEALALAKLSHPNVVQIHGFGEHDGRAHVVMEYVRGPTLSAWLAHERPSRRRILAVFRSAGEGLAAAHAVGVVHRDFKPDNVIVGDDGRVRVVDFGLALAGTSATVDRAGTPRYMAPEQLEGRAVDGRTDQYAFCVALHEALWGSLPARDSVRPRRPGWLWRCIRRGLATEPDERWPDMQSLLVALDVRPRRRLALAWALACAGAVTLGYLALANPDPCAAAGAELDTVWSEATAERLVARFTAIDPTLGPEAAEQLRAGLDSWAEQWRDVRARSCRVRHEQGLSELLTARRDACLVDQLTQVGEQLRASLDGDRRTIAHAWELAAAIPRASRCEDDELLRVGIVPPDETQRAAVEAIRAQLHAAAARRLAGHAERNIEPLAQARARVESLDYPPLLAEVLAEQAATEFMVGSPKLGMELLELASRQAYIARDDRLAGQLWTELCQHAVSELDDPDASERWLAWARDAWARIGPDEDARASLAFATGAVALERERFDEAAVALDEALHGPDPRLRPFVLDRQAVLAERLGERERGVGLRVEAREASVEIFGPLHPRTVRLSIALGNAYAEAGQADLARTELERALAAWRQGEGRAQRDLADALLLSCYLEFGAGNFDAALAAATEAESVLAEVAPDALVDRGLASNAVGTIEHARGRFDAAARAFARALELLERELGPDDELVVEVRVNGGANLLALDRLADARAAFEDVHARGPKLGQAWRVASLGLAEIELRSGAPERAGAWLAGFEQGDQPTRAVDRLAYELLDALIDVRLGRACNPARLAQAVADTDEHGRELLVSILGNLNVSEDERERLGLASLYIE